MRFLNALFLALSTAIATPDITPESSPRSITPRKKFKKIADGASYSVWSHTVLEPGSYSIYFGRSSQNKVVDYTFLLLKGTARVATSERIEGSQAIAEVAITDYLKIVFPNDTIISNQHFSPFSFTIDPPPKALDAPTKHRYRKSTFLAE